MTLYNFVMNAKDFGDSVSYVLERITESLEKCLTEQDEEEKTRLIQSSLRKVQDAMKLVSGFVNIGNFGV